MTDRTYPDSGRATDQTHIIRYALELGLLWIDGDGRDKVREALDALDILEAQLEAVGAGGVQALSAAPAVPHMSAAEVNNLPAHARAYIHQLASLCDPAGLVRENVQLLDTNNALQKMYRRAADACAEVFGCFATAESEGLIDALSDTTDERLKDLVERRLMYAMHAVRDIAASPTPQSLSAAPVEVADAMADSQYLAGVSAGWNAANADNPNEALRKLHESRAGYLKPLDAARKQGGA